MKKPRIFLLVLLFLLGAALAFVGGSTLGLDSVGTALGKLGQGLRSLSLSGGAGNALAWALLLLLGLLPLGRKHGAADLLWLCASLYALCMLYWLVNPHLLRGWLYPGWADTPQNGVTEGILLSPLASLLFGAVLLRLSSKDAPSAQMFRRFDLLLFLAECAAVFGAGAHFPPLRFLWGAHLLFGVVDALCLLAQTLCLILTLRDGRGLLSGLAQGWLRDENAAHAQSLAVSARRMLAVDVATSLVRCFVTLALGVKLSNIDMRMSLSLSGAILALAMLVLVRVVQAGIQARSENDQFI